MLTNSALQRCTRHMALRTVGAATRALASRRPCAPRVPVCAARGIHRTASACDEVHPLGQVNSELSLFSFSPPSLCHRCALQWSCGVPLGVGACMSIARVSLFGACRMVLFGFAGHELRNPPYKLAYVFPRGACDSDRAVLASTLHVSSLAVSRAAHEP